MGSFSFRCDIIHAKNFVILFFYIKKAVGQESALCAELYPRGINYPMNKIKGTGSSVFKPGAERGEKR